MGGAHPKNVSELTFMPVRVESLWYLKDSLPSLCEEFVADKGLAGFSQ